MTHLLVVVLKSSMVSFRNDCNVRGMNSNVSRVDIDIRRGCKRDRDIIVYRDGLAHGNGLRKIPLKMPELLQLIHQTMPDEIVAIAEDA